MDVLSFATAREGYVLQNGVVDMTTNGRHTGTDAHAPDYGTSLAAGPDGVVVTHQPSTAHVSVPTGISGALAYGADPAYRDQLGSSTWTRTLSGLVSPTLTALRP